MKKITIIVLFLILLFIAPKLFYYFGGIPLFVEQDIGPDLHVFGRPCLWDSSRIQLGNTGYFASVGPNIYQDEADEIPDFYTIDIQKRHLFSNNWGIYYERNFEIEQIPEELVWQDARKIVEYQKKERKVIFTIGKDKYEYILPLF